MLPNLPTFQLTPVHINITATMFRNGVQNGRIISHPKRGFSWDPRPVVWGNRSREYGTAIIATYGVSLMAFPSFPTFQQFESQFNWLSFLFKIEMSFGKVNSPVSHNWVWVSVTDLIKLPNLKLEGGGNRDFRIKIHGEGPRLPINYNIRKK